MRVFAAGSGGAYDSDIANGIAWAASHGAKVINLSLGATGGPYPMTLCNAVQLAINSYGTAIVVAAGNGDPPGTPTSAPTWPAACPGAIGVAATDESDLPGTFSNYGNPNVFVSAPGVDVLSTWPGGRRYAYLDGTSMASPYVAGLVGLIRSLHPEASVDQVREILALSSDKVGAWAYGADPYGMCAGCTWEQHYGYGRINVQRALSAGVPPPPAAGASPASSPAAATAAALRSPRHESTDGARLRGGRSSPRHAPTALPRARRERPDFGATLRLPEDEAAEELHAPAAHDRRRDRATGSASSSRSRGSYRYCVRASDGAGNRLARLRGSPRSVEDTGRRSAELEGPRTRVAYGWPKTKGSPLTLRLRRIAVRSVPPVKPVVT